MGILIMFNVTSRESFENVRKWVSAVSLHGSKDVVKAVLGNQVDREGRVVSKEEGEALAREFNMSYFETSAKTSAGVEAAFMCMSDTVLGVRAKMAEDPKSFRLDEP